MQSRDLSGYDITIVFLLRRELQWARSYWRRVSNSWNGWKNLLLIDRKMRKKNQIPEYHAPSPGGTMKTIRDRSMKNLLTQWENWGGKPKDPWSVIGEKPPNPGRTEEENQRLIRRGWRWCQKCRWKTSQPCREMGEENRTILEGDPSDPRRRKAPSEKRMRAMRGRRLDLLP